MSRPEPWQVGTFLYFHDANATWHTMKRIRVSSSTISSAGYDPDARILELEFTSGEVYRYSGVPGHHYTGLMHADSKGGYFNSYIKDIYPFRKMS